MHYALPTPCTIKYPYTMTLATPIAIPWCGSCRHISSTELLKRLISLYLQVIEANCSICARMRVCACDTLLCLRSFFCFYVKYITIQYIIVLSDKWQMEELNYEKKNCLSPHTCTAASCAQMNICAFHSHFYRCCRRRPNGRSINTTDVSCCVSVPAQPAAGETIFLFFGIKLIQVHFGNTYIYYWLLTLKLLVLTQYSVIFFRSIFRSCLVAPIWFSFSRSN